MQRFWHRLDKIADISADGPLVVTLERAIFIFLVLMAVSMPHSIAASQTSWLIGMALWLVRMAVKPRPALPRTPLDFVLWLFFGLTAVSAFLSYAPDISIDKLRGAALFLIVYFVVANVRTGRAARLLVTALIASCMVNVLWTPIERVIGRGIEVHSFAADSPLNKVRNYDDNSITSLNEGSTILKANGKKVSSPEEFVAALEQNELTKVTYYFPDYYHEVEIKRADLLAGATAAERLGIANWKRSINWRSAGFFGHYTTYSEVLQLIASLVFGLWLALPGKKSRTSLILGAVFLLMGVALIMTVTRASQGALIISALLMLSLSANKKMLLWAAAALVPIVLIGAFVMQQSRGVGYFDRSDTSTTWRETVYTEGIKLLTNNPRNLLVGVGMDSIKRHWQEWGMFDGGKLPIGHFHSTYLQIAVERGLPALAAWFLFIWVYLKMLRKLLNSNQLSHWQDRGAILGIMGGFIGFLVSGTVHYNYGDQEVVMVFYFLMGIAASYYRDKVVTPHGVPVVDEPEEEMPLMEAAPA